MSAPTAAARSLILDVPDFPKKGIIFKDITPLLADPSAFASTIDELSEPFASDGVELVAGIESRGFLLATAIAYRLKAGIVPIRKKGKLPRPTVSATYDLEYGQDSVEAHRDAFKPGAKVLLVDDVLATGGTAAAACRLLDELGGKLLGLAFLIELGFLNGKDKIPGRRIHSLFKY